MRFKLSLNEKERERERELEKKVIMEDVIMKRCYVM
jgi:hypothetical protein